MKIKPPLSNPGNDYVSVCESCGKKLDYGYRHCPRVPGCQPKPGHTPTPKWTAKPKTWKGNFIGFKVFKDGVLQANHINALRPDEAIEKAKAVEGKLKELDCIYGDHDCENKNHSDTAIKEEIKKTFLPVPLGMEEIRGSGVFALFTNGDTHIGKIDGKENAAFIVRAVNSHEDLLTFARIFLKGECDQEVMESIAEKAIAKAEGR